MDLPENKWNNDIIVPKKQDFSFCGGYWRSVVLAMVESDICVKYNLEDFLISNREALVLSK